MNISLNIVTIEFAFQLLENIPIYNMTKSFENVVNVKINPEWSQGNPIIPMNELFPEVRRLALSHHYSQSDCVIGYYQHLEHFHVNKVPFEID